MSEHAEEQEEDRTDRFLEYVHEGAEVVTGGAEIVGGLVEESQGAPGLGLLGGAVGLTGGMADMAKDPSVAAGLQMAGGAKDMFFDAAELLEYEGAAKYAGPAAAIIDGASAANDLRKGDYAHMVRDGVATGLDAVPGAGPAVSAVWKTCWNTTEDHIEPALNDHAANQNYLGEHKTIKEDEDEKGDMVNDWVTKHTGSDTLGEVTGAYSAMQTAVNDSAYTAGHWAVDKLTNTEALFGPGGPMTGEFAQMRAVNDAQKLDPATSKAELAAYQAMGMTGATEALGRQEQDSSVAAAMALAKSNPETARAELAAYAAMGMNGAREGLGQIATPAAPVAPQNDNVCRPATLFNHYAE